MKLCSEKQKKRLLIEMTTYNEKLIFSHHEYALFNYQTVLNEIKNSCEIITYLWFCNTVWNVLQIFKQFSLYEEIDLSGVQVQSTLQILHDVPFRIYVTFRDLTELENREVFFPPPPISSSLIFQSSSKIMLRKWKSVKML